MGILSKIKDNFSTATKTIAYKNYVITKSEDGSFHIKKDGVDVGNVKACLREIANKIGCAFNPDWNQRQLASNLIKAIENVGEGSQQEVALNEDRNEEVKTGMYTYYLRLESDTLWRFDTVNFENADEDDIYEGFNDRDKWAEIVGETRCLYTQKEDLEAANDGDEFLQDRFEDEDAVSKIISMIGDNCVHCSCYCPDAEDGFSIVVLDENEEEIETIDASDIPSFRCEQGYVANLNDYDEEDEEYVVMSRYLEQSCNPETREHAFTLADENSWFWLNVQKCSVCEHPVYQLDIPGEFDASKLSVKKVLVEEAVSGMMSIECITQILYDGEPLDISETAEADEEECTNFIIKMS